jgi:hypothetical protein
MKMGMDVGGCNPKTVEGEYFHNNWWAWRPLAQYCQEVAPEITGHCKHWDSNDGDGLSGQDSLALADSLQKEIDSGRCKRWAELRASALERLPNEPCFICEGTGIRKPTHERGAGDAVTGVKCNACKGDGYLRPWDCHYGFSVENVQAFVVFLRSCGGFRLH